MTTTTPGAPFDEPRATLALWDYRRRVADIYAGVREMAPDAGWDHWRAGRDTLFAEHSQSALAEERRASFGGLSYFDYDPGYRVEATVAPAEERHVLLAHSANGATPARSFGVASFLLPAGEASLTLWWLEEYGGGVFAPFRDLANGHLTYGGGRYLLDTAKGADLGGRDDRVLLDFGHVQRRGVWVIPRRPRCLVSSWLLFRVLG